MGDHHACCHSIEWSRQFFMQYMQYHTAMTRWVENMHQQASNSTFPNVYGAPCIEPECTRSYYTPHYNQTSNHVYESYAEINEPRTARQQFNYKRSRREEVSEEYSSDESDLSDSEDEELSETNDEAESLKSSCESQLEDVKGVNRLKDDFEYVELDKFGNLPGCFQMPNVQQEEEADRVLKFHQYGKKMDTIAGLEMAILIEYNRQCDLLQPDLWPILPLNL